MGFIVYLMIGLVMFTYTSLRIARKDPERMKNNIREWIWWAATLVCVLVWPVILAWAIYDAIRVLA